MSDDMAEQNPIDLTQEKTLRERYEPVRPIVKNAVDKTLSGGANPRNISEIRAGAFHVAEALHEEAVTDSLTGLYRRNMFRQIAEKHLSEVNRNPQGQNVEFAMLDLDNFGDKNKKYGESAGDKTLELVGKTIKNTLRDTDTAGRWGGEEIVMVMPQLKQKGNELTGAQRIGEQIATVNIPVAEGQITESITASIGTTNYITGEPFEDMFERASLGVRLAKLFGKNRSVQVTKGENDTLETQDLSNGNKYIYERQIFPRTDGTSEMVENLTDLTEMTKNVIVRDNTGKKYLKIEQVLEPAA